MAQPVPILLYHSVGTTSSRAYRRLTVAPETFARHMSWLAQHDFRPMTVSALVYAIRTAGILPPRPVVITFDDGLRDFLTDALPILQRHHFPATLFVATGYVGSTALWLAEVGEAGRPMLGWDELREISRLDIECGAHTHSHPELDILAPAAATEEIRLGKVTLENRLGREVQSFAYPYGYASRTTRRLAREAGFASACRVRHALSSTDENLYALSRIIMTDDIAADEFLDWLGGEGLAITPPADRLVAYGWRLARRVGRLSRTNVGGF